MSNDPDYEATQRERRQKRYVARLAAHGLHVATSGPISAKTADAIGEVAGAAINMLAAAEVVRLRKALDRIANGVGVKHRDAQKIAREALKAAKP